VRDPNLKSDEALMSLLVDGDSSALESIYERHRGTMYAVALSVMGDHHAAEEVLQDAFFQIWRKCTLFDPARGPLIGWLLTITRRRAISRVREQRSQSGRETVFDEASDQSHEGKVTSLDQQIARQLISTAFTALPEPQRRAITMAYFEGFTCEEIASRTQTPEGTVKARLRYALRTMNKVLTAPPARGACNCAYPAGLSDVLVTDELASRPVRKRRPEDESESVAALAKALDDSPERLVDAFLQMPIDLCRATSSGLSLLGLNAKDESQFLWTNVVGELAPYVGGTTPRNFSPCGVTLDCNAPQLFRYPGRYFDYFNRVAIPIVEGLVVPFRIGSVEGTTWIVSHNERVQFDSEDARIMSSLADFTGGALHLGRTLRLRAELSG
jgi:RNA polymerase sigma factor (sigma-70 family)